MSINYGFSGVEMRRVALRRLAAARGASDNLVHMMQRFLLRGKMGRRRGRDKPVSTFYQF
jgi:hypothetical protein